MIGYMLAISVMPLTMVQGEPPLNATGVLRCEGEHDYRGWGAKGWKGKKALKGYVLVDFDKLTIARDGEAARSVRSDDQTVSLFPSKRDLYYTDNNGPEGDHYAVSEKSLVLFTTKDALTLTWKCRRLR